MTHVAGDGDRDAEHLEQRRRARQVVAGRRARRIWSVSDGADHGEPERDEQAEPEAGEHEQVADLRHEEVVLRRRAAPHRVDRRAQVADPAEPGEQDADQADDADAGAVVDRGLDRRPAASCRTSPGTFVGDVVEQALLRCRVRVQHEAGDRHREQQQREQRQEAEVGDRGGVLVAVVALQQLPGRDDVAQPGVRCFAGQRAASRALSRVDRLASCRRSTRCRPLGTSPERELACASATRRRRRARTARSCSTGKRATKPARPS